MKVLWFSIFLVGALQLVTAGRICLLNLMCFNVTSGPDEDFSKRIDIWFYNGTTVDEYTVLSLHNAANLFNTTGFDVIKPTVLYLHGYTETPLKESVKTVVSAYLSHGGHNVLAVDWSVVSNISYLEAARAVPAVGLVIAEEMDVLLRNGLPLAKLHVVGHSLGGQVAGHIGKYVKEGPLPRITALDPAMPLFYGPGDSHIDANDADLVDVIHTDGGAYGALSNTGDADFFPNGGTRYQPGCPPIPALPLSDTDLCSHWRSWRLYAESVTNQYEFPVTSCSTSLSYRLGFCSKESNEGIYMGYATNSSASGSYYLDTNRSSPYGRSS